MEVRSAQCFSTCVRHLSVPHNHLLDKLTTLNLCPYLLQWIYSYLSDRSQVVAVGGELSSVKNVVSGVPQGSVLGPLLFTIYIDDVAAQISPSSSISFYADDIALYCSIRSPADYLILQADITAIATCVEEEKHLNFNVNKCYLMLTSRKHSHSITPPLFIKTDTAVEQVDSVKYLGVLLTSDLTWTEHISRICNKTRKLIGLMYRRFHHCHPDLMLRLYKAFIRPHLEYALQVWDPYLAKDIELLERTQKFALRVCCKNWSASYCDLLECCQVPSLSDRRMIAKMCHLYKIICDRLRENPAYGINAQVAQCAFLVPRVKNCPTSDFVISMSNNPSTNCYRWLRRLNVSFKGEISRDLQAFRTT